MNGEQIPIDELLKMIGELFVQIRIMQKEIEKLRVANQEPRPKPKTKDQ